MEFKKWSEIMSNIALIGQLGLSIIMPLLICLFICYEIVLHTGAGVWVYIPGFIMGIGGSGMTAWKVYQLEIAKQSKKKNNRKESEKSFNIHY